MKYFVERALGGGWHVKRGEHVLFGGEVFNSRAQARTCMNNIRYNMQHDVAECSDEDVILHQDSAEVEEALTEKLLRRAIRIAPQVLPPSIAAAVVVVLGGNGACWEQDLPEKLMTEVLDLAEERASGD
jgi:hypothetical protein